MRNLSTVQMRAAMTSQVGALVQSWRKQDLLERSVFIKRRNWCHRIFSRSQLPLFRTRSYCPRMPQLLTRYGNDEKTGANIFSRQITALHARVGSIIENAGKSGAHVVCLQEAWSEHLNIQTLFCWQYSAMPFAFCTREKHPWTQFAEPAETGVTTAFLSEVALYLETTNNIHLMIC